MGVSSVQSCVGVLVVCFVVLGAGSVDAVGSCPRVKTNMETWDWSPLSGTTVKFNNKTAEDGNNKWTVDVCGGIYSNAHDFGRFSPGAGSIKFHQPSDTFYMLYKGGDRGDGCESDPRQADLYLHCQGCPDWLHESNTACTTSSAPCVCAAWQNDCIGEVHMVANCPIGVPNYRRGFDVYDASMGIKEDISKVIIKDGEVMPGWTDEDTPSEAQGRAVIPGSVKSSLFYIMISDEDVGLPQRQQIDEPDVFTDETDVLTVTTAGSSADGGLVTADDMLTLQLDFHCHKDGLANVHVEISFSNQFYPADFAFTYQCGSGGWGSGWQGETVDSASFVLTMTIFCIISFCVVGCAYNYTVHRRRGDDIIPGVIWLYKARDVAEALYKKQSVSSRFERPQGYQSL